MNTEAYLLQRQTAQEASDPFLSSLRRNTAFRDVEDGPSKQQLAINFRLHLYVWARGAGELRLVDLKQVKLGKGDGYKRVECIGGQLPEATDALAASQGTYLCAWSPKSLCVLRLPTFALELEEAARKDILRCPTFAVGRYYTLGADRVLQVRWHPLSEKHLVVLWASGKLQIYDVEANSEEPEQEFELGSDATVDFAFGPPAYWGRFSIYLLRGNGDICCLCPVVPHGCLLPRAAICALDSLDLGDAQSELRRQWVQGVLRDPPNSTSSPSPSSFLSSSSSEVVFSAHLSGRFPPALQGPLHCELEATATSLACAATDASPMVLLRSFEEGCVDVLVSLGLVCPAFDDATAGPPPPPLDSLIYLWDRVDLRAAATADFQLYPDPFEPNTVFVQGAEVQAINMGPWLPQLRALCRDPTAADRSATLDAIMAHKTEVRTVSYNTGDEAILGFQVLSDPLLGHYCLQLRPQQCIVAPSLQARHAPELLAITNEVAEPRGESGSAFQEAFGRFQATYHDYKVQSHVTAPIQLSSAESCAQFVEHRKRVYNKALKDILELEAVMGAHVEELGVEVTGQQHSFDEVEREITQLLANQARIQEKIKLQREASAALLQGLSVYRPDHGDLSLSDAEQEFHTFLGQLTDLAAGVASVEGGEGGRLALTGEVGSRLVDLRNAVEDKRRYKLKY
jgi:hypothetical protein